MLPALPLLLLLAPDKPALHPARIHPQGAPVLQACVTVTYLQKGERYVQETYYVDAAGLRAAAAGRPGRPLLDLLRTGEVASATRMTFLVDISKAKRRELLERTLPSVWPVPGFSLDLPDVRAFLAWQGRSLNQGDQLEYAFHKGGGMSIRFGRGPARRFESRDLSQALRTIEFTDDAETPGAMAKVEAALQALLR